MQYAGRVVRRGNCEYRYDTAGRLEEKKTEIPGFRPQVWRYRWDALNQIRGLITPEGERWQYACDAFGRRISKRREGGNGNKPTGYDYLWSGDQLIEETPVYADGTPAYGESIHWLYEPGALTPLARREKGQLHYVVSDHMGTPRELLTEKGDVAWASRLSTWGKETRYRLAVNDDRPTCNLRFAGQYADEESGLHYNRHRYYDSETGQYLSPDPIGLAGGFNPYGYVHNPLAWVDPLGLACCPPKTGSEVTEDMIKKALEGDPMQSLQGSVSLPAIQRYVDRLLKGDVAPPIKIDGNVVVEGNHRYVAGKVAGKMPETTPGTLSPSQTPNIKPMSSTTVDDFDWGNH
ncbi:RHS domain-containing protein [Rahnella sp. SAP-29]|nr:RHS domain-containing protein [Rahnella laticis]